MYTAYIAVPRIELEEMISIGPFKIHPRGALSSEGFPPDDPRVLVNLQYSSLDLAIFGDSPTTSRIRYQN